MSLIRVRNDGAQRENWRRAGLNQFTQNRIRAQELVVNRLQHISENCMVAPQCTRHETELFLVAQPQHGVDARTELPDVLFVRYFDDVRLQRTRPNNDHGIRCM